MLGGVSEYAQERKGFWYEADDIPTSETVALEAWVRVAHDLLSRTADTYHAVMEEADFAEKLQATSGIRTTRPYSRWLDKVLGPLARYCDATGEPPLDALVLSAHDDLPAARLRLECYRWAGSAPADGGEPAPHVVKVSRPAPASRVPSRVAKSDQPVAVCPRCFMAIPATGICDNCG